jgi:multidrug efflux system membrane fusion protein
VVVALANDLLGGLVEGRVERRPLAQPRRHGLDDIEAANPDNKIPDGITVEVGVYLDPAPATEVPRSALIFSSAGDLGVRTVDGDNKVKFQKVTITEDLQQTMWVDGLIDGARVIVQGQDFVRDGQLVEAVSAADYQTARK